MILMRLINESIASLRYVQLAQYQIQQNYMPPKNHGAQLSHGPPPHSHSKGGHNKGQPDSPTKGPHHNPEVSMHHDNSGGPPPHFEDDVILASPGKSNKGNNLPGKHPHQIQKMTNNHPHSGTQQEAWQQNQNNWKPHQKHEQMQFQLQGQGNPNVMCKPGLNYCQPHQTPFKMQPCQPGEGNRPPMRRQNPRRFGPSERKMKNGPPGGRKMKWHVRKEQRDKLGLNIQEMDRRMKQNDIKHRKQQHEGPHKRQSKMQKKGPRRNERYRCPSMQKYGCLNIQSHFKSQEFSQPQVPRSSSGQIISTQVHEQYFYPSNVSDIIVSTPPAQYPNSDEDSDENQDDCGKFSQRLQQLRSTIRREPPGQVQVKPKQEDDIKINSHLQQEDTEMTKLQHQESMVPTQRPHMHKDHSQGPSIYQHMEQEHQESMHSRANSIEVFMQQSELQSGRKEKGEKADEGQGKEPEKEEKREQRPGPKIEERARSPRSKSRPKKRE